MVKGIKKAAAISAALVMLLTGTMITGCELLDETPQETIYEYGDFKYKICEKKGSTEKYVALHGLTKEGEQKEIIVVPSEIKGIPVTILSYGMDWVTTKEYNYGVLVSKNLKAIYIPSNISITEEDTFTFCPNLKKVVFLEATKQSFDIPYKVYELLNINKYVCVYQTDREHFAADGTAYASSWSITVGASPVLAKVYYANVSYMYNYAESENEGYYWVDNFIYGDKIGYIPKDPARDGYSFGGWYKEESCVNQWDFATDTLPEAKYNDEGNELYQETKLYAKWIEA